MEDIVEEAIGDGDLAVEERLLEASAAAEFGERPPTAETSEGAGLDDSGSQVSYCMMQRENSDGYLSAIEGAGLFSTQGLAAALDNMQQLGPTSEGKAAGPSGSKRSVLDRAAVGGGPVAGDGRSAADVRSAANTDRPSMLSVHSSHLDAVTQEKTPGTGPPRRKGKKTTTRNIFLEFGMDSDAKAMTEVNIGGVIVKRFNVKRFWQSDEDLTRWRQGMGDNSRFNKLLLAERGRFHEDFPADRSDLVANHNGYRRQRSRSISGSNTSQPQELTKLRQQLEPKEVKHKKGAHVAKELAGFLKRAPEGGSGSDAGENTGQPSIGLLGERFSGNISSFVEDQGVALERSNAADRSGGATEALRRLFEHLLHKHGSLEAAFRALDLNGSGRLSLAEFLRACADLGHQQDPMLLMRVLDKNENGSLSGEEFMRLRAFVARSEGGGSPISSSRPAGSRLSSHTFFASESASAIPREQQRLLCPPPPVETVPMTATASSSSSSAEVGMTFSLSRTQARLQAPQTVALLIFRNGEASHKGEPILVRRWPPATMAELLKICAEGCRPLIPPSTKLLTGDLRTVRSLAEVEPGKAYLLKGIESLDPPMLFFEHKARSPCSPSLRNIHREVDTAVAEQDPRIRLSPKHLMHASVSQAPSPAGSPSWATQGERREPSQRSLKWQDERGLSAHLCWGGLGVPPSHHDFYTWSPALAASRSIDRRSLSSPSL